MNAELKFIGHISTPYQTIEECPRNIDFDGPLCQIVLDEEFKHGLTGLKPGQRILVLYWLGNAERGVIQKETKDRGLKGTFALRTPHRPNPVGAAVIPVVSIENCVVTVRGLDCLSGTPLIDIKPAIKLE